jgi:DNA-binding CsgD family transcriptional regulator
MSELCAQDFESIFQFYTKLNNHYDDMENTTLRLMAELFNLRLTSYAIFDLDNSGHSYVRKVISHTFRTDRLEHYRKYYYKKDLFYSNIYRVLYTSKYVYTSDAFPPGVFENSEYGKWLAAANIGHQAILGGNVSTHYPIHVLCSYKTVGDGPFTERELELFHYIGKAFSETMRLYKRHLQQQRLQELIKVFTDTHELGFAILDSKGEPLSHNAQFITFGTALSDKMEVSAIIDDLTEMVATHQGAEKGDGIIEAVISGYLVTLQEKKIFISPNFESYTFISIQRSGKPTKASVTEPTQIQLTEREHEVMELLHQGKSSSEIAGALYISQSTAKSHIRNLSIKLGATSRADLRRIISKQLSQR